MKIKQLSKYSKAVAKARTQSYKQILKQNKASGQRELDFEYWDNEKNKNQKTKIENQNKTLFDLAGACPFIIDFINYTITHNKKDIYNERGNPYYYIKTTKQYFIKTCMDGEQSPRLRERINKNTNNFMSNPKETIYYILNKSIEGGQPIVLKPRITKKKKYLFIFFDKRLFYDLYKGKGRNWFMLPNFIQTKIEMLYEKIEYKIHEIKTSDNELGRFLHPLKIRRFLMYVSLHDNYNQRAKKDGKNEYINIDIKEMLESVYPNGLKDGKTIRSYENTAIFLLYSMLAYNAIASETENKIGNPAISKKWLRIPKTAHIYKDKDKSFKARLVFTPPQEVKEAIQKGEYIPLTWDNLVGKKLESKDILRNIQENITAKAKKLRKIKGS